MRTQWKKNHIILWTIDFVLNYLEIRHLAPLLWPAYFQNALTIGVHDIVYTLCFDLGEAGKKRKKQNKPNDFWFVLQEHAFESSQKYKEGKYIIEMAHMIKENGWESPPKK